MLGFVSACSDTCFNRPRIKLDLLCYAFILKHICVPKEMQWVEKEDIIILASPVAFLFNTQKLFLSKPLLWSDVV